MNTTDLFTGDSKVILEAITIVIWFAQGPLKK